MDPAFPENSNDTSVMLLKMLALDSDIPQVTGDCSLLGKQLCHAVISLFCKCECLTKFEIKTMTSNNIKAAMCMPIKGIEIGIKSSNAKHTNRKSQCTQ